MACVVRYRLHAQVRHCKSYLRVHSLPGAED
jgi:hypothetical protein